MISVIIDSQLQVSAVLRDSTSKICFYVSDSSGTTTWVDLKTARTIAYIVSSALLQVLKNLDIQTFKDEYLKDSDTLSVDTIVELSSEYIQDNDEIEIIDLNEKLKIDDAAFNYLISPSSYIN